MAKGIFLLLVLPFMMGIAHAAPQPCEADAQVQTEGAGFRPLSTNTQIVLQEKLQDDTVSVSFDDLEPVKPAKCAEFAMFRDTRYGSGQFSRPLPTIPFADEADAIVKWIAEERLTPGSMTDSEFESRRLKLFPEVATLSRFENVAHSFHSRFSSRILFSHNHPLIQGETHEVTDLDSFNGFAFRRNFRLGDADLRNLS